MMKRGINHGDSQMMNRELIFGLLKDNPQLSRSDLAELSGLRPATITNIVSDLIAAGLVEEAGTIQSGMGRRPIELRLIGDGTAFLIFSFTGPSPTLCHVSLNGEVQQSTSLSMAGRGPDVVADCVVGHAGETAGKLEGQTLHGIGVIADSALLTAMDAAAAARGFEGADAWLSVRSGVKTYIAPKGHVCALAAWSGHPKPAGPVVYLSVGATIEAAVYTGNQRSSSGDPARDLLGHLCISFNGPPCACGCRGCLTLYASTEAIRADIREKRPFHTKSTLPPDPAVADIAKAFHSDDPLARSAVISAAGFLAIGLDSIIRLLRPTAILLGGDIPLFGQEYLSTACTLLRGRLPGDLYDAVDILIADDSETALRRGMYDFISARSIQEIISSI